MYEMRVYLSTYVNLKFTRILFFGLGGGDTEP